MEQVNIAPSQFDRIHDFDHHSLISSPYADDFFTFHHNHNHHNYSTNHHQSHSHLSHIHHSNSHLGNHHNHHHSYSHLHSIANSNHQSGNNYYYNTDDISDAYCKSASLSSSYLSDYVSMQFDSHSSESPQVSPQASPQASLKADKQQQLTQQQYLSIEDIQTARNSCSLCGCNWQQEHVSLDCSECGGYSLTRPCPDCDGKCNAIWERNINLSHEQKKAAWTGLCELGKDVTCYQSCYCCFCKLALRLA